MGDASWSPLYDLYAISEEGIPSKSVSLHYRVNLQQKTGEDWNDAKLILSTSATDILDAGVPTSENLVIEPKEKPRPPPSPVMRHRMGRERGRDSSPDMPAPISVRPLQAFMVPSPITYIPPLMETTAIISKNPMAVSYTVDEPTTIPSDHRSHKVLVAIIPFEATVSHITSPRKSPMAYLQVGVHLLV